MTMMIALIVAGLVLLFAGGEFLVRGSVGVARRLGMSELLIGLTLVGFGTSMPELVTSLQALSDGATGLSIGNVVGSNVANVLLVIGAACVISPIVTNPRALARDGLFMIAVTALFAAIIWIDGFTRPMGFAFIGVLLVYLVLSVLLDRRKGSAAREVHSGEAEVVETNEPLLTSLLLALGGIAGVIFGARFLVQGGSDLARMFGISETVIGLSIVAIGTSLPELVTSVVSALKGKADVALGNVIGSNIFNILGIMGVSAAVFPFSLMASPELAAGTPVDVGAMEYGEMTSLVTMQDMGALALSVFLLVLFAYTGRKLARWEGAVLLLAYAVYMSLSFGILPRIGGF
ncbi:sodium:calcium antiporter [Henriciella barbarensis]|uniref:Sodium:calcium antiporter n=1 Tax=Henriciella barbarensis TaxID=86342 RepID=A0A399QXD5_9PROT|nr:calcium/sodium antiporter [Henriciella barbarensis]RIJ23588.1 sodium:calcium antiporter [Henriciella barbarensis]